MIDDSKAGPAMGSALGRSPALIVVRHGETEWSRSGRHTGTTDVELTATGREQAKLAGFIVRRLLNGQRPGLVLSSPRQRALETARLAGFAEVEPEPDAAEWDYGQFEGRTTPEIRKDYPDWTVWAGPVPDGESEQAVQARMDRLLGRISAGLIDGPVLVFSHGHASRCLTARWLGQPITAGAYLKLGTGAVCALDFEHEVPAILHWNIDATLSAASAAPADAVPAAAEAITLAGGDA